ncbi:MAG: 1,4-lactonase [Hyphomicrobiales bacterium]|nr:1,4-lactonase [Hyphomicrobiales bacterium]
MNLSADLFIDSKCTLAEGPMWHPEREELFWFDIHERTLFRANVAGEILQKYLFEGKASAAAVIDRDTVLVASVGALLRLNLVSGRTDYVLPLEVDKPGNRPNDSRVNPAGGFWIGTMADKEDGPKGSVYQYRAGKLERLFGEITVTNSICFSPDGATAYFSDTPTKKILKRPIDPATGMPTGDWSVFVDVEGHRGSPDGSVVDTEGFLWSARWGGGCVVRHAPDGSIDRVIELPTAKVTCPAFGGPELKTLYITTACNDDITTDGPERGGGIFSIKLDIAGQREPTLKF